MNTSQAVIPINYTASSQQPASAPNASHDSQRGAQWAAFATIWTVATALTVAVANECSSILNPSSLFYGIVLWGWWGVVASTLWIIGTRRPFLSGFSPSSILLHTIAAIVLGIVHPIALWSLGFTGLGWYAGFPMWKAFHALLNLNRFGMEILIYGFVFGLIGVVQYQIRAQREKLRSVELERELSAAQLRALQMQLEPHFLFNTLNAITTLVELDRQQEAVEMLAHLNAILKSTLKRTTPVKVPLWQELEVVENYLAIEQVRFADRLRIEIKVEPGALDSLVPCFLLQPIVENAIRHGIARCESDGLIEASARRDNGRLLLEVRNSGSGRPAPAKPGNGIGLKNTRERLTHFYHEAFDMKALPMDTGGFQVAIAIPYERG